MNWKPVDIIVGAIVTILMLVVVGGIAVRFAEASPAPDFVVAAWENFIVSAVAIISLYVGSKVGKGGD